MTQFLSIVLSKEGYQVAAVNNGREALERARTELRRRHHRHQDARGWTGSRCCTASRSATRTLPVIVMTAYASQKSAIDAVNLGAFQYLEKNAKNDEIKLVVATPWRCARCATRTRTSSASSSSSHDEKEIIGNSEEMTRVFKMVDKVADTDATILIVGESGTGKELIAREIHYRSRRATTGRSCRINCGAIPRDLLESKLFGHVKGSFTGACKDQAGLFEVAEGGTFFLDEVGEMPLGDAGQAAARAAGARDHPGGRHPADQDRLPADRGHQRRPRDARWPRAASAPTSTTGSTSSRSSCRRCATRRDDIPLLVDHFLKKLAAQTAHQDDHQGGAWRLLMPLRLAGQRARAGERDRARGHPRRGAASIDVRGPAGEDPLRVDRRGAAWSSTRRR